MAGMPAQSRPAGSAAHLIRLGTAADLDAAAATLGAAFADYPFTRHTVAAADHVARVTELQRLFLEHVGLPCGRVWVSDDVAAVAVWTTPTSSKPDLDALAPRLRELAGDRAAAAAAAEEAMVPHRPTGPVWFLATVGVAPGRQGEGLGRAVLAPGLRAAAAEGHPAYLETSLESNVGFYQGLGFQVTAQVALPDGGPTTWAMRKDPA